MKTRSYHITNDRQLKRLDAAESHTSSEKADVIVLTDPVDESLSRDLAELGVPPTAVKACTEEITSTRIAAYGRWLLIAFPVCHHWDDSRGLFLVLLCTSDRLIAISAPPLPVLENMLDQYTAGMCFHRNGIAAVLYQAIDFVIDENMAFTIKSRDELEQLEALSNSDFKQFARLAAELKRQLGALSGTFEDQLYCVRTLQTVQTSGIEIESMREYLRDSIADLEYAARTIERQESRVSTAQQEVQLRQQAHTNEQLRILTIVSTIFLPLTLIVGVYGMNFESMPEYAWKHGYAYVLTLMTVVTLAMLLFFYRRSWFK